MDKLFDDEDLLVNNQETRGKTLPKQKSLEVVTLKSVSNTIYKINIYHLQLNFICVMFIYFLFITGCESIHRFGMDSSSFIQLTLFTGIGKHTKTNVLFI